MFGITVLFGLRVPAGCLLYPRTVYTFPADVDEIYTRTPAEGIWRRRHDLLQEKILRSIVVFSMGAILSFYGFQSKAHSQPESAR